MSDERLREAERRWKESGSVDDEARYLLERVRVGDLTQERLELAAYCGKEPAVRVLHELGAKPLQVPENPPDLIARLEKNQFVTITVGLLALLAWQEGILRFGEAAKVSVLHALALANVGIARDGDRCLQGVQLLSDVVADPTNVLLRARCQELGLALSGHPSFKVEAALFARLAVSTALMACANPKGGFERACACNASAATDAERVFASARTTVGTWALRPAR